MKTMGSRFGCFNRNGQDVGSLDGYTVTLILQDAFNPKEFLAVDHHAVFLVKVRIRNHVRKSCFIYFARTYPYFFRFSNTTKLRDLTH
jgi:hypothetical protein